MARQETAGTIINRVAVEVGLRSVSDPYASNDDAFIQMVGLLNVCGNELIQLHNWEALLKEYTKTTSSSDTNGQYDLPDDYDRFVSQTGWDRTNDVPVIGPLSPQDWSYLKGRDFADNSIYVSYRIYQGKLEVYPQPPPDGVDIAFEYISRNWAETSGGTGIDETTTNSDVVLFDPLLMQKMLKVKFLSAKNLPTTDAKIEFDRTFQASKAQDNGGMILSASRNGGSFPLLDGFYNLPDTGYGG